MEERRAERILIIGGCGGGKSTFSKVLGEALKIKVCHLDKYFWKPGWVETEETEWNEIVRSLISKESWIIEGNYSRTFKLRAQFADKIYLFDYSTAKYIYRILKRSFKTKLRVEKRTDMGEGCDEKWFDKEFFQWVWNFNRNVRPQMYNILDEINFDKNNLIIFKKNKDVKQYLNNLKSHKEQHQCL